MIEEIIDLLVGGWTALSEPIQEFLESKKKYDTFISMAHEASEEQIIKFFEYFGDLLQKYDNRAVKSFLFLKRNQNKTIPCWSIIALNGNKQRVWKRDIKVMIDSAIFNDACYIIPYTNE